MYPYAQMNLFLRWNRGVTALNGILDSDRTAGSLQRAREFEAEAITDCLDLPPIELGEDRAEDAALFLEELKSLILIPLRHRGVPDHVGEHYGG